MKSAIFQVPFNFIKGAATSRGIIDSKLHFFVRLTDDDGGVGWGECAPIKGLTPESEEEIRNELLAAARSWEQGDLSLDSIQCSAVKVAFEMALGGLAHNSPGVFFSHPQSFSIQVNGLVWMNEINSMLSDAQDLITRGFRLVKCKVDGKNWEDAVYILKRLRQEFSSEDVRIRLDANGSFPSHQALAILHELHKYDVDSIEQPLAAGNWNAMAEVCRDSPIPVALDEELIGVLSAADRDELLHNVMPKALVLKPSLHGGFASCDDWIERCAARRISWWCTSYLESNLGLAALAQWLSQKDKGQTHGLGTGRLYRQNFTIPASIEGGMLLWNGNFSPSMNSLQDITQLW